MPSHWTQCTVQSKFWSENPDRFLELNEDMQWFYVLLDYSIWTCDVNKFHLYLFKLPTERKISLSISFTLKNVHKNTGTLCSTIDEYCCLLALQRRQLLFLGCMRRHCRFYQSRKSMKSLLRLSHGRCKWFIRWTSSKYIYHSKILALGGDLHLPGGRTVTWWGGI